jgi:hypothetical protein
LWFSQPFHSLLWKKFTGRLFKNRPLESGASAFGVAIIIRIEAVTGSQESGPNHVSTIGKAGRIPVSFLAFW